MNLTSVGGRGDQDGRHHRGAVQDVGEDGQGGDQCGVSATECINISQSLKYFSTLLGMKYDLLFRYESSLKEGLSTEKRIFYGSFALHDRKEGMNAFVNKRKPKWEDK